MYILFVISIVVIGLLGIGAALCRALGFRPDRLDFETLGIWLASGLTIFFSAGMASPSLLFSRVTIQLAAVGALAFALRRVILSKRSRKLRMSEKAGISLLSAMLVVWVALAFERPLRDWDARSIWYFQAKVIYYADGVLRPMEWSHPTLIHPAYPKLNAFYAALLMRHFSGWNEYLPKLSLLLLSLPAILFCIGFTEKLIGRILLLSAIILRIGVSWTNGYMDGLVAIYTGLISLYGIRYAKAGRAVDLMSIVVVGGLLSGIKNEGMAIAALVTVWSLIARAGKPTGWNVGMLFAAAAAYLHVVIWNTWKHLNGIDFDLSRVGVLERISTRLSDGSSLAQILGDFFSGTGVTATALYILVALILREKLSVKTKTPFGELIPAIGPAICYFVVLTVIYLSTPHDLTWHLNTSIDRTPMPIIALVVVSMLWLSCRDEITSEADSP